jgi:sporulation protein YlmC with PRC-barrel domain
MEKPEETRALLATSVIGLTVHNLAGEQLGRIEDFVLDMSSGRIAYAIMASAGFLRGGERLFAVPIQSMTLDLEQERFTLDADKKKLEDAPGFDREHLPKMGDRRWGAAIHAFYGQKPYWE